MKKIIKIALVAVVLCSLSIFATHITVNEEIPGILGLFDFRPDTGDAIKKLVRLLLCKESTLSRGDRQLIAAYVSWLNQCAWCCNVHSAIAHYLLGMTYDMLQVVKDDFETAPITEKLKALLNIARHVQQQAQPLPDEVVARARAAGATDLEIHDAVLIAAVFCMNNRYVMCLDAETPTDPDFYDTLGKFFAQQKRIKNKKAMIFNPCIFDN